MASKVGPEDDLGDADESHIRRRRKSVDDALQVRRDEAYMHVEGDLHQGTVPLRIKLTFCAPTVSTLPINVLLAVYVSSFYEKMGADLGYISLFIALARSFDVLSDPAMSYLTDSCRSKHGRRRPFMLSGAVPYGILLMVLLGPPAGMSSINTAIWFGLSYISFYLCGTWCNIPYDSLGPELTDNYDDRSQLFFISGLFDGIGSLLGIMSPVFFASILSNSATIGSCMLDNSTSVSTEGCVSWTTDVFEVNHSLPLYSGSNYTEADCASDRALFGTAFCNCVDACNSVSALDAERNAFFLVGLCFGGWYIVTMINCVFWIKERSQKPGGGKLPPPPPMVPSMLNTMENVAFTSLLPSWALDAIFQGILSSMLMYFVRYAVVPEFQPGCNEGLSPDWKCNSTMVAGLSVTVLLFCAFLGTPVWLWIASKWGKRKTWLLWSFTGAATNFLFIFVGEGAIYTQLAVSCINGFPMGAKFLADAITADIIDYDEFLTGQRSEATYTMFKSFLPKICAIPASAIPLALLNTVGHIPPVNGRIQRQPESVKTYVIVVSVLVASSFSLMAWFLKFRFPLRTKEQCDMIAQGVGHHMKGEPGIDPVSGKEYSLSIFEGKEQEHLYLLNNFLGVRFIKGLKNNYAAATEKLHKKMKLNVVTALITFVGATATAIFTVLQGWLNSRMLSFVPVMAIIMVGVSLTFSAFNSLRLKASGKLLETDMNKGDFLDRVAKHRQDIDDIYAVSRENSKICRDNSITPGSEAMHDNHGQMDGIVMGNSLYADMIGVKNGTEEDDELHAKESGVVEL